MSIPFLDLKSVTAMHAEEIQQAVARVVSSGWYLLGEEVKRFERQYAEFIGTRHCVGCANGLDALTLMLRAYMETGRLHEGDEVIVPANTYIATILAITENRLRPVLVEPSPTTLVIEAEEMERAITPRTKAVMLVHLYGRINYSEEIGKLVKERGLLLFEDNAQAHGCRFVLPTDEAGANAGEANTMAGATGSCTYRLTGSLGDAAAHSFYPGKNLGALGDGGAVTTDDEEIAALVRTLANYGSSKKYVFPYEGRNSRLDELQAAVLSVKLQYLDEDNAHRRAAAEYYREHISNPLVALPEPTADAMSNVHHIFPVLCTERDRLQRHLADNGIGTVIHYPIPPHMQDCYKGKGLGTSFPVTEKIAREELSLPMSPYIKKDDLDRVVEAVNSLVM